MHYLRTIPLIGLIFLFGFTCTSPGEAKKPTRLITQKTSFSPFTKKKPTPLKPAMQKRPLVTSKNRQQVQNTGIKRRHVSSVPLRHKTRIQPVSKPQPHAFGVRKTIIKPQPVSRPQPHASGVRKTIIKPQPHTAAKGRHPPFTKKKPIQPQSVALKKYSPVRVPFKATVPAKPHVSTPARGESSPDTISLSFMKPHTQQNAKLGKLDHLYAKNISGSGQMVAVIEYSGEWHDIEKAINNRLGIILPEIQERYRRNFLTPIGGGRLHPEEKNGWLRLIEGSAVHGSDVSSVVMDFAPHTKVLPVSTYYSPEEGLQAHHFYDTADALMDLARRKDVNIINISSGYVHLLPSERKVVYDANGQIIELCKDVFAPKIIEAFKAVAKAGKVVVLAAGNDEGYIKPPDFTQELRVTTKNFIGHLLQTLDPETRKAILIAGNVDPLTHKLSRKSNKPGPRQEAQDRFVGVPGRHKLSYIEHDVEGTSFAAPYLAATVALLSSKGYAPQRVTQALLETAEKDPDVQTYGMGRMIRADRALKWLEEGH